jgi:hypothetical protein
MTLSKMSVGHSFLFPRVESSSENTIGLDLAEMDGTGQPRGRYPVSVLVCLLESD